MTAVPVASAVVMEKTIESDNVMLTSRSVFLPAIACASGVHANANRPNAMIDTGTDQATALMRVRSIVPWISASDGRRGAGDFRVALATAADGIWASGEERALRSRVQES